MLVCAACEKPMKRNAYSWSLTWDRPEGFSKKSFTVRFHNKPECINVVTERMDGYAFDQRMADAFEGTTWGFEDDEELVVSPKPRRTE